MRRKKTIIMITMCVAILFMTIGYAVFSTSLQITSSTSITSNWQVEFTSISTVSTKGGATNKVTPTYTATTVTFEVDLVQPGDSITYGVVITNKGTLPAEIKSATYTATGSDAIYVNIDSLEKGDIIDAYDGKDYSSIPFTLTVGYDPLTTSDPESKTKTIQITINVGQYVPNNPTPSGPLVAELERTLVQQIFADNTPKSDLAIDYAHNQNHGLYFTSKNTENNMPTYFFRGTPQNNYVSFAGEKWQIIRINEDGTIRIMLAYSLDTDNWTSDPTVEKPHYSGSTPEAWLNEFYRTTLLNYDDYIADTGFCNDTSVSSTINDGAVEHFGAYDRLMVHVQPHFACPKSQDLYTVSSGKGNGRLTYPIGLITADEVVFSGLPSRETSPSLFGEYFWTMTPYMWDDGYLYIWAVDETSDLEGVDANYSYNIRPVINLNADVKITGGIGSSGSPYVIRTS